MKFIAEFQLERKEIRADNRRTFISFFKKAIESYMDGRFFKDMYQDGAKKKSFVWSLKFTKPNFKGDVILLGDTGVEMTLKCDDVQTALIYYSAMLEQKDKKFPVGDGNHISLKNIRKAQEKEVVTDTAIFKVLSPICLKIHEKENSKDRYLTVEDSEFAVELNKKICEDLPYMCEEINNLKYNFEHMRKVIVPAYGIKIQCTIGSFTVAGDHRVLNHMLKNGVGSKRNSGFGLLEQRP